jgi:hypothetical protein
MSTNLGISAFLVLVALSTSANGEDRVAASWYGDELRGNRTASGEKFNPDGLTAAHKTLPFGTCLVVGNPRNGKSVNVRVNDRGPFAKDRVLDLAAVLGCAGYWNGCNANHHDGTLLSELRCGPRLPGASSPIVRIVERTGGCSRKSQ